MIVDKAFDFSFDENRCSTCEGNCCIGESGYIWITTSEIDTLSKLLNISVQECFDKYLIKYDYKFSIKEKQLSKNNYACIFFDLDKKQCSIYEARPKQCRTFPFWEHFKTNIKEVIDECPAIVVK
jgi:Fe-S-cluster containining protein